MKKVRFALFFIIFYCHAQGQSVKLPQVTGPSPEAATLQKYGDYKVSTYTGVPNITLPIYTMQVSDLAVPISISYHGGGIKVDEEASRVGLGWSLNAGGTISRDILGLDDLNPYASAPNSFDLFGFPVYSVVNQLSIDFAAHTYNIADKIGETVDPTLPFISLDLEPDVFYCNFLGINNKFILQKNDTSVVFEDPSMNMKVKFNITPHPEHDGTPAAAAGVNCTIQCTGNDGTIYNFDQFETCKTTSPTSDVPTRITAWYLTKIQSLKGAVINFNYAQSVNFQTYSLNHLSISKNLFSADEPSTSYIPHNTYWCVFLSSITSSSANVYFNYDTRLDLNGDRRLTSVQIKDGNATLIKTVNLMQDYFTANSSSSNSYNVQAALWGGPALDTNWLYKRLKLTALNEVSPDNQTTLSHNFEYNESLLPLKNTTSSDHYGFFNNASNAQNLLPDLFWAFPGLTVSPAGGVYTCSLTGPDFSNSNIEYLESVHRSYWHWKGANREIDTNYSRAFVLNKITYPTGGYTKFEFEQNTYDRRKSYAADFSAPYYNYMPQYDSIGLLPGIPGIPVGYSQSYTFAVTAADTIPGEGNVALVNFQLYGLRQGSNTSNSTTATVLSLINSSNVTLAATGFNSYTGLISNGDGTFSPSAMNNQRLPVGTYTLKISIGGNVVDKNSPFYAIIATWNKPADNTGDGIRYKLGGGLRIRNISNYSLTGVLATSMDYLYHFSADSNNNGVPEVYSTGKAMDRPHYLEGNIQNSPHTAYLTSEANCGAQVGYDSVIIQQNQVRHMETFNNTCYRSNLYNTHISSTIQMMPVGFAPLPWKSMPGLGLPGDLLYQDIFFDYKPQGIKDFTDNANGKMIKSVDYQYDSITGKYKVIKLIQNTYTYSGTGIQGIIWADRMLAAGDGQFYLCYKGLPPMYGLTNYFYPALRSVAVLPAMTIVKTYTATDSLSDTTTYTYSLKNQLNTKTNTNSKGEILTEFYAHPLDFYNVTPGSPLSNAIISLKNNNNISPVIEQYLQKKSSSGSLMGTIQATLRSYKPGNNVPDTVWAAELSQPSTVFSSLSPSGTSLTKDVSYKPQLIFSKYDVSGNIVVQQRSQNVKNVYLWNYFNAYPVCQVTNADSADIAYTSFEADNPGNWTVGAGSFTSAGGITGAKYYALSSGASIAKSGLNASKNYVVTYWSRSGSLMVNGATANSLYSKGVWTFYQHKLAANTTAVTISGTGIQIDELRLLPIDAQMITYTYIPLVGQSSVCSINNIVTYYEYDGLQRLLRIRDMDGNIVKQYEYQYQQSTSCGNSCFILPMTTLAGTNTISYPVGVFNVSGKLLGNAANQSQYISLWNTDTADAHRGALAAGGDSLHFNFTLIPGKILPVIIGCRYYQVDMAWNQFDGFRNSNAAYVAFGDGTGMRLPGNATDVASPLPPGTTTSTIFSGEYQANVAYYIHNYSDTLLKTMTFYHNDSIGNSHLDNVTNPASSMIRLKNLRGNLPQNLIIFGSSCYQDATMNTVTAITNWKNIHSVQYFNLVNGDQLHPSKNMSYAQDFMQYNQGLKKITTASSYYRTGYRDTTFRLSRLKTDWNTFFTELESLQINQDHWNHEDLSGLKHLNYLRIEATTQNHQDDSNSPLIPMTSTVINAILNQVAAGAGQTVYNGTLLLDSGGGTRTSASDAAVQTLISKGWAITINGVILTYP
jgi:hypothetical protein